MKYIKRFDIKERRILTDEDRPYKWSEESGELWNKIKDDIEKLKHNKSIYNEPKRLIRPIIDEIIENFEKFKIIGDVNKYNL